MLADIEPGESLGQDRQLLVGEHDVRRGEVLEGLPRVPGAHQGMG
jgi:hypothetical protein